jgi:hypothetical protein
MISGDITHQVSVNHRNVPHLAQSHLKHGPSTHLLKTDKSFFTLTTMSCSERIHILQ